MLVITRNLIVISKLIYSKKIKWAAKALASKWGIKVEGTWLHPTKFIMQLNKYTTRRKIILLSPWISNQNSSFILGKEAWNCLIPHSDDWRIEVASRALTTTCWLPTGTFCPDLIIKLLLARWNAESTTTLPPVSSKTASSFHTQYCNLPRYYHA